MNAHKHTPESILDAAHKLGRCLEWWRMTPEEVQRILAIPNEALGSALARFIKKEGWKKRVDVIAMQESPSADETYESEPTRDPFGIFGNDKEFHVYSEVGDYVLDDIYAQSYGKGTKSWNEGPLLVYDIWRIVSVRDLHSEIIRNLNRVDVTTSIRRVYHVFAYAQDLLSKEIPNVFLLAPISRKGPQVSNRRDENLEAVNFVDAISIEWDERDSGTWNIRDVTGFHRGDYSTLGDKKGSFRLFLPVFITG